MPDVTINRLGDEAQHDNHPVYDAIRPEQIDRPLSTRLSARDVFAHAVVYCAGAALLLVALAVIRTATCWGQSFVPSGECVAVSALWWSAVVGVVVTALAVPLVLVVLHWRRTSAEVARASITRDRFSNPIAAEAVMRKTPEQLASEFLLAAQTEIALAPFRQLPVGLDSLSVSNSSANKPGEAAAALAADMPNVGPLPLGEWMSWIDKQPHVLLAAKTGGGKSTLAKAILAPRIAAGDQVFAIDPHYQAGNWFDLPGVGGGEDFDEVAAAFVAVGREYQERLEAFKQGKKTEDFARLTVLLDEAVITKAYFDSKYGEKARDNPWRRFAIVLGSGARKVRISIVLMSQSALVQDLGLSGALRENFSRLALDTRTIRAMIDHDESDRRRREVLYSLLPSQGDYPAVAEIGGQVFCLDRTGVAAVAEPANSRAAAWDGWDYETASPGALRPAPDVEAENGAFSQRAQGAGQGRAQRVDPYRLAVLLFGKGKTYREVQADIARAGLSLDKNRYKDARDEALAQEGVNQ